MLGFRLLSERCATLHADLSEGLISAPDLESVRKACLTALAEISIQVKEQPSENGEDFTQRREMDRS